MENLFHAPRSYVCHFVVIHKFKLELSFGNAKIGAKSLFFDPCDLQIWWMTSKKKHLFYATSSFVHHFEAIGEFKLELQSGNTHFGSKSSIDLPIWPWNFAEDLEKQ